jgi:hypothetical protein
MSPSPDSSDSESDEAAADLEVSSLLLLSSSPLLSSLSMSVVVAAEMLASTFDDSS